MHALWALSEGRHLAAGSPRPACRRWPCGDPQMQQRVFGNAATFMSRDLHLLDAARDFRQVARWLRTRVPFAPDERRAAPHRRPCDVRTQWVRGRPAPPRRGAPYPTWMFLELGLTHELWRGSSVGPGGSSCSHAWRRSRCISRCTLRGRARRHTRPGGGFGEAAAECVDDPEEVPGGLARRLGLADAGVRDVLDSRAPTSAQVVEGPRGMAAWWVGRVMRGDLLPPRPAGPSTGGRELPAPRTATVRTTQGLVDG